MGFPPKTQRNPGTFPFLLEGAVLSGLLACFLRKQGNHGVRRFSPLGARARQGEAWVFAGSGRQFGFVLSACTCVFLLLESAQYRVVPLGLVRLQYHFVGGPVLLIWANAKYGRA